MIKNFWPAGRADSDESMDQEILISINSSAFDETPTAQQMNLFDAAKVMMTFKRVKHSDEEDAPPTPAKADPVNCARPIRKGSAKKGVTMQIPFMSLPWPFFIGSMTEAQPDAHISSTRQAMTATQALLSHGALCIAGRILLCRLLCDIDSGRKEKACHKAA